MESIRGNDAVLKRDFGRRDRMTDLVSERGVFFSFAVPLVANFAEKKVTATLKKQIKENLQGVYSPWDFRNVFSEL